MGTGLRIDFTLYLRALPLLVRNPVVIAAPLLAGVIQVLLQMLSGPLTDAVGGFGAGIFQFIGQIIFGFAFGVAIIFAEMAWRRGKASFDSAWEEARRKSADLVFAAIGFLFIIFAAQYLGAVLGSIGSYILGAAAVFFMIYTIPAAAIGGAPGGMALSASVRAVRANYLAAAVLAIVAIVVYYYVSFFALALLGPYLGLGFPIVQALFQAIAVSYLAFVFAKQYDEVAFTRRW
ncbi:MAG: hypothetical protein M3Y21_02230 [Candidatus Eremiobacteraeota bacterium]|nr:hypothetical protein [Candidatus Eremiobacteraeota bacterium]